MPAKGKGAAYRLPGADLRYSRTSLLNKFLKWDAHFGHIERTDAPRRVRGGGHVFPGPGRQRVEEDNEQTSRRGCLTLEGNC